MPVLSVVVLATTPPLAFSSDTATPASPALANCTVPVRLDSDTSQPFGPATACPAATVNGAVIPVVVSSGAPGAITSPDGAVYSSS